MIYSNGFLVFFVMGVQNEEGKVQMTQDQFCTLYQGCSLRNIEYIIGAVIFSGHETKVMMNSMNVPSKRSTLERKLDGLIITLFGVFFCTCLIGAFGRSFLKTKYFYLGLHGPFLSADMNPSNRFWLVF